MDWREDIDVGLKRSKVDLENWKKRDPIRRLEKALLKKKILSNKSLVKLVSEIYQKVENDWSIALKEPYPNHNNLTSGLYASKEKYE